MRIPLKFVIWAQLLTLIIIIIIIIFPIHFNRWSGLVAQRVFPLSCDLRGTRHLQWWHRQPTTINQRKFIDKYFFSFLTQTIDRILGKPRAFFRVSVCNNSQISQARFDNFLWFHHFRIRSENPHKPIISICLCFKDLKLYYFKPN